MNKSFTVAVLMGIVVLYSHPKLARAQAVPTTVMRAPDGSYQLLRDGKPYFIKGGGGNGNLDQLKAAGGNSIRTWGVDANQKELNDAAALGLTVTLGIWLGHRDNGFHYDNPAQVAGQLASVEAAVKANRDHPALLVWGLGNEAENGGEDREYYTALEAIAHRVKALDPNHPTMTVVAEIGGGGIKAKQIAAFCPDIDILGVNSYGGLASLPKRLKEAGWTKPYIVTEFGPSGQWETGKTSWGAAREPTSTEKATTYAERYRAGIADQRGWCLGSYAFLWGSKVEATPTWYGLFLTDGAKLGAVDTMTEKWSGKLPAHLCPDIQSFTLDSAGSLEPGANGLAHLSASDPDGLPLHVRYVLRPENKPGEPGTDVVGDMHGVSFTLPTLIGPYRLYAYVDDGKGAAATANVPFLVQSAEAKKSTAQKAVLPLSIYGAASHTAFVPSGWMGDTASIKMDENCATDPRSGSVCLKCSFNASGGWAGVVWQSPANDWGTKPGGWNVTGAKKLVFWARGQNGGEIASFEFGLIGADKPYFDTGKGKLGDVPLTTKWTQYVIPLEGQDLSRIKTGFCWTVAAHGTPIVFYLDDVHYE